MRGAKSVYQEGAKHGAALYCRPLCCCNLCLMANTIIAPNYAKHPVLIKRVRAASTASAASFEEFQTQQPQFVFLK
jgi:hypothetical protein